MRVQVLYFEGCPNHRQTVELAEDVVRELCVEADIEEVEVKTGEDAERLRFLGSPTVFVDGVDIDPIARKRTDYSFSCRMYEGLTGVPPRTLLTDAICQTDTSTERSEQ